MSVWVYLLAGLALLVVVNVIVVVLLLRSGRLHNETRDGDDAGSRDD